MRSLLYGHPHLTIPPFILLLSWIYAQNSNPAMALLLGAGCTIAVLSLCGRITEDYIDEAERVGSTPGYAAMIESGREVIVARWGPEQEVIGVAVVELVKEGKGGKGVVWALAVRLRYRRHGVGKGLLEEVVKVVRKRFGDDTEVVFADAHASTSPNPLTYYMRAKLTWGLWLDSYRISFIPKIFNKVFDKDERKVRAMLEEVRKTNSS